MVILAQSGYLFVYVSNETQNEKVFFDNLVVQQYTGPLTEETNLCIFNTTQGVLENAIPPSSGDYPFGLVQAGISGKAFGRIDNRKKFNGYEENKDLAVN